jgi:hypothetical protein
MEQQFTNLYSILLNALKGKHIIIRDYYSNSYESLCWPSDKTKPQDWTKNKNNGYREWQGIVIDILENDNSHVDIIFEKNEKHVYPEGYSEDAFGFHMNSYIKILN